MGLDAEMRQAQKLEITRADVRAVAPGETRTCQRVLVVEDDVRVRDLVSRTLMRRGYVVESVATAETAVELLQYADPFDLLIADVVLPRMSGADLAAEAHRMYPHLGILLMSGYSDVKCDGRFIRKPFTPADLLHEAAGAIRSASS